MNEGKLNVLELVKQMEQDGVTVVYSHLAELTGLGRKVISRLVRKHELDHTTRQGLRISLDELLERYSAFKGCGLASNSSNEQKAVASVLDGNNAKSNEVVGGEVVTCAECVSDDSVATTDEVTENPVGVLEESDTESLDTQDKGGIVVGTDMHVVKVKAENTDKLSRISRRVDFFERITFITKIMLHICFIVSLLFTNVDALIQLANHLMPRLGVGYIPILVISTWCICLFYLVFNLYFLIYGAILDRLIDDVRNAAISYLEENED